jgi:hypothetical protein
MTPLPHRLTPRSFLARTFRYGLWMIASSCLVMDAPVGTTLSDQPSGKE